jgi:hypothetical protein
MESSAAPQAQTKADQTGSRGSVKRLDNDMTRKGLIASIVKTRGVVESKDPILLLSRSFDISFKMA